MVCITAMKLCKRYSLNLFSTVIPVSEEAATITGTSAYLRENDNLTLWDLLHGMMLPSGNDAGFLLAEYFGKTIKRAGHARIDSKHKLKSVRLKSEDDRDNFTELATYSEISDNKDIMKIDEHEKSRYLNKYSLFKYSYVKYFIMEMNYIAREEFNLISTFFDSPHGMINRFNISSAADIGKMSSIALTNPLFAKIVKTKRYKCYTKKPHNYEIENPCIEFIPKQYIWENTNKLLWRGGYTGLKTGITQSAGPCLAASFKCDITDEHYIIVILNSRSMEHRWSEINKLKMWASARMRKIKKSNLFNKNPELEQRILTKIRHL